MKLLSILLLFIFPLSGCALLKHKNTNCRVLYGKKSNALHCFCNFDFEISEEKPEIPPELPDGFERVQNKHCNLLGGFAPISKNGKGEIVKDDDRGWNTFRAYVNYLIKRGDDK